MFEKKVNVTVPIIKLLHSLTVSMQLNKKCDLMPEPMARFVLCLPQSLQRNKRDMNGVFSELSHSEGQNN